MRAGQLRHRVQIQERHSTQDHHGNPVETWQTIGVAWGRVEPIGGGESRTADKVNSTTTHKVTLRYRAVATVNRVVYQARAFDVNQVLNTDERNRELVLLCTEVAANG